MNCSRSVYKRRWPFRGYVEPPLWLRHLTPWWVLWKLQEHYHLCWTNMVRWKMGDECDWNVTTSCFEPYDYCGFYDRVATKEEREEGKCIARAYRQGQP
ncbi:hypothetical protein LCGC14_0817240 [marine sediment metagenome]|uniref:Uncharacterized protein n=1 Tax=marine sediment metagenome TaxID=412755 RepID=A0A0F9SSD1_9ZZZZ